MRHVVPVVALILVVVLPALPVRSAQSAALKIVVIAGEDAVNVIQQKTAVAPVIEVRDRNDLPVAGATVIFSVPGKGATFGPSAQTFTVATDSAGRAVATGFNPVVSGPVQINVQATYQGQMAGTTITQTNVLTAAQAAAATGSTVASAGAAAGGAAGGGLSAGAIAGIVGAGVGGAALGAKALTKEDPPPAGMATTATAPVRMTVSPSGKGIREVTEFSFSASGADAAETYAWDFGDGTTATGNSVTHVFTAEGRLDVRVRTATAEASQSIEVGSLTGTWLFTGADLYFRLVITQDGTNLVGEFRVEPFPGAPFLPDVSPLSGTVAHPRSITVFQRGECLRQIPAIVDQDLRVFIGPTLNGNPVCTKGHGDNHTFRRQ